MRTLAPARKLWQAGLLFSIALISIAPGRIAAGNGLGMDRSLDVVTEIPTPQPDSPTPPATSTLTATASPTASLSSTPPLTPAASSTQTEPSASPTPSDSPSPTASATAPLATDTATTTSSATATHTPTETPTPSPTLGLPTPFVPQAVLINEIAWAGTLASANDEWIELHNPGPLAVDLTGWSLADGGDIHVILSGSIGAYGYFLLERTDDTTVADLTADLIYTGSLSNNGEALQLVGPSGEIVDSANADHGGWPAGSADSRASMERRGGLDISGNWGTFTGYGGVGHDAAGNPIPGTPRSLNSLFAPTPTPTPMPTPSLGPSPNPPLVVLINEVAWAGTLANASDEWIELHNPGPETISLQGWKLTDGDDINVALAGSLPPYGYFLLERTDDQTISDISADQLYTGSLNNEGESLWLSGPQGELVDSANADHGGWPAGSADSPASMERRGGLDISGNWGTFTGYGGVGHDAAGNPIPGTPRSLNSLFAPTPVPTWIPGRVVINEVLIRPHHDWEGAGGVTSDDEFIELYNHGPGEVYLRGWFLDDIAGGGSNPADLPGITIPEKGYAVFFRSFTQVALNDDGDSVRLLAPDGRLIDQVSYLQVRAYNLSYGRLPDGSSHMAYGLWPTPGESNRLYEELIPPRPPGPFYPGICTGGPWPAGSKLVRASMERRDLPDDPGSWASFGGNRGLGRDAEGDPISGTPGGANWSLGPTGPLTLAADGPFVKLPLVLIHEVAWAGTRASATDEWIELYNPGPAAVDLAGWTLTDQDDINIALAGVLNAGAYYLLERTDDLTISDIPADLIYTGRLEDDGETLWLMDASGRQIDSANAVGRGAPHPLLPRAARQPAQVAWLRELNLVECSR